MSKAACWSALLLACAGQAHPAGHASPAAANATSPAVSASGCAGLEPLLAPLIRGGWLASASIALVDRRETDLCSFGQARKTQPATPDTLYEIGSLTKLFTGVLLAQMVESGAVRLNEPVNALLGSLAQVAAAERPMTLLDLASHRSGLPRMPDNLAPKDPANPYVGYDEPRLFEFLARVKAAPPTERYLYSNLGAALLGQALAQRASKPYLELVRAEVLDPLGMKDTVFTVPPSLDSRRADGHDSDGAPEPGWDFDAFAPAGALRSSARDMGRFVKAALATNASSLGTAFQLAETPRAEACAGRHIGLFFLTRPDGSLWHNGETGGFSSYVGIDPQREAGVVVLLSTAFTRSEALGDRVLAYVRGKPIAPLELPSDFLLPARALGEYEAQYPLSPDFIIRVFRRGDRLYAQATGQNSFGLWPSRPDHFYLRAVDARVEFERNGAQQITALVLDQGGKRQRAPRSAR